MISEESTQSVPTEQVVLTDSETLSEVLDCLTENISLHTQGAFDKRKLFEILVRAASCRDSIENTAKTLNKVPCGNDIRYHLKKIDNFEELEEQINSALRSRIPDGIKKSRHKVAIDLNLIPYYGEASDEEDVYIYRSQAKSGTCSFYAYATLYLLTNGKRVTLAIKGIRRFDTNVAIITYLLSEVSNVKLRIKKLYLDRGFFSISVIRWLQALDIPFTMPAIRRGKKGGINQFLKDKRSYKTTYVMSRNQDDFVEFDLCIVCKYKKGKRGKRGVEYFAYVTYKTKTNLSYIHQDYRKRFGIESSYRLKNICRIRTNNKNPILRLLFVGISFILVNIWVHLLWLKISLKRKGGRLIYRQLFGLKQMLAFLRQAIERKYQTVESIHILSG